MTAHRCTTSAGEKASFVVAEAPIGDASEIKTSIRRTVTIGNVGSGQIEALFLLIGTLIVGQGRSI